MSSIARKKKVSKSCKWCGENLAPEITRYECNPCRNKRDYNRRKAKKQLEKEQLEVIPKGEAIEGNNIEEKMNCEMLLKYFRIDRKLIYQYINSITYYDNKIKELENQVNQLNLTVGLLSKNKHVDSDTIIHIPTPPPSPYCCQELKTSLKSPPSPPSPPKQKNTPVKSPPSSPSPLKQKNTPVKSPPKQLILKLKTSVNKQLKKSPSPPKQLKLKKSSPKQQKFKEEKDTESVKTPVYKNKFIFGNKKYTTH